MNNAGVKEMKKREQQWRAEEDAMIMARYNEILSDKARLKLATKMAQKQANELQKKTNAMKKVAKKGKK